MRFSFDGVPLDPWVWADLLQDYLSSAEEEQVIAARDMGLDVWPMLAGRDGRLRPTWSGASITRRIYARTPPIQGLPKPLRGAVQEPGKVVLAADWRASHLAVLARASGDPRLLEDVREDPYAWPDAPRRAAKISVLAAINGAGEKRLQEIGGVSSREVAERWPTAWSFLEGLRRQAEGGQIEGPWEGPLKVPEPHQAPAYYLQAAEAEALRGVLAAKRPEGLELVAALHDETVWLVAPEDEAEATRWLQKTMGAHAQVVVQRGPSWGELGEPGVGRDRARSSAMILHRLQERLRVLRPGDDVEGLSYEAGLFGALEPEASRTSVAVLEARGLRKEAKALRAMMLQGRRAHQRAEAMVASASREEVEASPLPLFKKGDQLELGQHLASCVAPPGMAVHTQEGTRVYDPEQGAWSLLDDHDLESGALEYGQAFVDGPKGPRPVLLSANAIAGIAKVARLELHAPRWEGRTGAVAFENGVLEEDGSLLPHDPSHRVLVEHVFPGVYDEEATCPRWELFLEEVFAGDADAQEKILFLQEYLGAAVFGRATDYQIHPMLWGPSAANGKSVFIKTVRALFPASALASTPPQSWGSTFGKSALLHARMNLITELPEREIVDSGPVKAVLTGDPVEVNRKYQDPLTVELRAGHILAANELPRVTDRSQGFFRRFAMVRFNRRFTGDRADRSLPHKLQGEIPGIMAWAVRGYQALRARGCLVLPESHDGAMSEWQAESASEIAWVQREVAPLKDPTDAAPSQSLYEAYRTWCGDQGLFAASQVRLGKALKAAGYKSRRVNGRRAWCASVKKAPARRRGR